MNARNRLTSCFFALVPLAVAGWVAFAGQPRLFAQDALASNAAVRQTVPAPRLLPSETLAYLRVESIEDIRNDWGDSSLGKMLADPKMRPFASDIYQIVSDLFDNVGNQLGISLEELLALPQGQVAIALLEGAPPEEKSDADGDKEEEDDAAIARRLRAKRRQQNSFAVVVMIDAGDSPTKMRELVAEAKQLALKNNFIEQNEQIGSIELTRLVQPRGGEPIIEWFENDGFYVIGVGRTTAQSVAKKMNAIESAAKRASSTSRRGSSTSVATTDETLSQNTDFIAVMSRSIGAEAEIPQVTFFVNPYGIVKRIIARSGSAFFIAPIVQDLGIEKIRGLGGSLFRGGEIVETIAHLHVIVDPPRDGFFGVLRPEDTNVSPPDWVPADAASFNTVSWNFEAAFENLGKIIDKFAGEGRFAGFTEKPIQDRVGVSLRDELFPLLTGRFVAIRRYQLPATWNSLARAFAFEVKDAEQAKGLLDKVKQKLPASQMNPQVIQGKTVYFSEPRTFDRPGVRVPENSVLLLDNWLILSDSREIVDRVLSTSAGTVDRLADDEDYMLLTSELGAKLEGETPFFFQFNRDAETYRMLYEMANSEETAGSIERRGGDNAMSKRVAEMMRRDDWPAWSELTKYFSVSGTFGYDEPGGIHMGAINLRPIE